MASFLRFLPVIVLCICLNFSSDAQSWQWAQKAAGSGNESATAIDIDGNGNSYITGRFQDSISFGNLSLNTPGLSSFYIAKYNLTGGLLWARLGGSGTNIYVNGICVDKDGNIAVTGQFFGTAAIGAANPVNLSAAGDYDVFVARFSSAGSVEWAQSAGGPGIDYGIGVSTDNKGNTFITGDIHISSFPGSSSKVFIARYDNTGNCTWSKKSLNYGLSHIANGIRTDSSGNSFVAGNFFNMLTFDSTIIADAGNIECNAFIARFTGTGDVSWIQKAGAGSGYMGSNSIDIDPSGNAYITGFFKGLVSLGPLSLQGVGNLYQCFVAKLDASGDYVWAESSTGQSNGISIYTDLGGNSYVAGLFLNSIGLGSINLTNTGMSDLFITKLDQAGNFVWAAQAGGKAGIAIGGIKAYSGHVVITGSFSDTLAFSSSLSLPADSTNSDAFIARLDDNTASVGEEHELSCFSIFPNPAHNSLHLKGAHGNEQYIIYDAEGRMVNTGTAGNNPISVSDLKNGIYFIQLIDRGKSLRSARLKFTRL